MGKYALAFAVMIFACGGCGWWGSAGSEAGDLGVVSAAKRVELPAPSGGFALAVGEETVTSEEIVSSLAARFEAIAEQSSFEQFQRRVRGFVEAAVTEKVSTVLLYQRARKEAGEDIDKALEKAADKAVREFVVSFGGDLARAEGALSEMGMDWADFRQYQKRQILSRSYLSRQLGQTQPVTYSDLRQMYEQMKDEFTSEQRIEFRLIDIQPALLEVSDPNQDRPAAAKELAEELVKRLGNGEDFAVLAEGYSHGHRREFGGLWKPVDPASLAQPYDVLAEMAEGIEPGEIAGPVVAGGHIFIMKLVDRQVSQVEPFEKVQGQLEAQLVLRRRKAAVDKISAELVRRAQVGAWGEFVDFCVERLYEASLR